MSSTALRIRTALPYVIICVGLAVLMWPLANAWVEAYEARRGIAASTSAYDAMSDVERDALHEEALEYNRILAHGGDLTQTRPYLDQLSFRGSDMIAYISIPKCSIMLPIYHGVEEKVLMAGVGHLPESSLPAGGDSTHCVLTAHTGITGRIMFDDIHLLEPGDEFVVWVLGEPLAYRVTGSEKVLPDQTESIRIQPGRDLCTLVTCTPRGINSHRLLVHAERCEYTEGDEQVADAAVYVNGRTAPLLVAVAALALLAAFLVWCRRRRVAVGEEGRSL